MSQIKPNPSNHQHFLDNKEILKKQIQISNLSKKDKVIEIGAGDGRLTKLISPKVEKVLSFEIDKRYKKTLENLKLKNVEFVFSDAIKSSWQNYNKIVSNIPYFLSEQIIEKAIKENILELVLIVGENFKKKLEEGKNDIAVLNNIFYKMEIIQKIDKKNFNPVPRVNSYLIKLTRLSENSLQKIYLRKGKIKNSIIYSLVSQGKTKRESRLIIEKLKLKKEILEKSTKNIKGNFLKKIGNELNLIIHH